MKLNSLSCRNWEESSSSAAAEIIINRKRKQSPELESKFKDSSNEDISPIYIFLDHNIDC